jgi:hypothetical protein
LFTPYGQISPVMVPLVARWATWLLGLVITLLGGGSERTQALRLPLAIATTTLLTLETIALCRLFDRGWPRRRDLVAVLVAVDLAFGLVLMAVEGGWNTAYYELALTSVMLPATSRAPTATRTMTTPHHLAFDAGVPLLTGVQVPPGPGGQRLDPALTSHPPSTRGGACGRPIELSARSLPPCLM